MHEEGEKTQLIKKKKKKTTKVNLVERIAGSNFASFLSVIDDLQTNAILRRTARIQIL